MKIRRPLIVAVVALAIAPGVVEAQTTGARALTFDEVLARFMKQNLAVEAARHRVDVARAEQVAARLYRNPSLTLTAENVKVAGDTPAAQLYELSATYSQPIERPGTRALRREVADLTVAVAEAELDETLRQRLADVKRAFYEALLARRVAEHARDNRAGFEELIRFNEVRFKEGAIAEAELLKTRLERLRFDTAVTQAELDEHRARIRLLDLLNEPDFAAAGPVTGELVAGPPVLDLARLREAAVQDAPGVRKAARAVALAERRVPLEQARGGIEVAPFVGMKQTDRDSMLILGIQIPLPLFDRNQPGIARASAEARIARTELARHQTHVRAEIESAYRAWQTAGARVAAFERELLAQGDEARAIARRAYQDGGVELIAVLEAERTRADIRQQYAQALFDLQASVIALEALAPEATSR